MKVFFKNIHQFPGKTRAFKQPICGPVQHWVSKSVNYSYCPYLQRVCKNHFLIIIVKYVGYLVGVTKNMT